MGKGTDAICLSPTKSQPTQTELIFKYTTLSAFIHPILAELRPHLIEVETQSELVMPAEPYYLTH